MPPIIPLKNICKELNIILLNIKGKSPLLPPHMITKLFNNLNYGNSISTYTINIYLKWIRATQLKIYMKKKNEKEERRLKKKRNKNY